MIVARSGCGGGGVRYILLGCVCFVVAKAKEKPQNNKDLFILMDLFYQHAGNKLLLQHSMAPGKFLSIHFFHQALLQFSSLLLSLWCYEHGWQHKNLHKKV